VCGFKRYSYHYQVTIARARARPATISLYINMGSNNIGAQVAINVFLFLLVMGMSSTVDIRIMRKQLRNCKAISIGLFCQFVLLPFLGYLITIAFNLPVPVGVTLIIVVSSPGGSYSNWWCSIFNADLGLSVSMTTASTFLSIGFLPLNLFIYTYAAYNGSPELGGQSVIKSINFGVIFISIAVVIGAIATGIFCSYKFDTPRWHRIAYLGGNISGIALIIFSTVLSLMGLIRHQKTRSIQSALPIMLRLPFRAYWVYLWQRFSRHYYGCQNQSGLQQQWR
jgi:predicted Na+-dependent transporter